MLILVTMSTLLLSLHVDMSIRILSDVMNLLLQACAVTWYMVITWSALYMAVSAATMGVLVVWH